MKKQLRLVLFAAIIAILVVMTAIGVSAEATDGADVREEGHYYEVVGSADGATPKYYATLASAVAAIDADGYTVTVLGNVTEPAITLDKAYAYTITGGEQGATITFSSKVDDAFISATAGKVTLDNVTVTGNIAVDYVLYIDGATDVVLNNVKTSVAAGVNTVYANASTAFSVSGDKTDISGATEGFFDAKLAATSTVAIAGGKITSNGYIIQFHAALTVSITGGELIGAADSAMFCNASSRSKTGSTLAISGATVTPAVGEGVINFQVKNIAITLGTGAVISVENAPVFEKLKDDTDTVNISGAEIHLKGAGSVLYAEGAATGTVTTDSGKIFIYSGAAVPAAELDAAFDWTKLTFVVVGISGQIELTEAGTYNIDSSADLKELAAVVARKAFDPVRFEGVTITLELDTSIWIPIVLNGEGVVVNVTAGEYRPAPGDRFATVTEGTLNITGGSFYANEGIPFISMAGGSLKIAGGTFAGATHVIDATGGAIEITGGSFTLKGFADEVTDAALLKYTADTAIVIGAADGTAGPTVTLGASVGEVTFAKGFVLTSEAVELTLNAGTFVAECAGNVIFDVPATIAKLEIKGGSYSIKGAGATLFADKVDRQNNAVTITGGTVTVSSGAITPVFNHIESSALALVLEGAVQYRITTAGNFEIGSVADIYELIRAYFTTSVTVLGDEAAWISLILDCADATVTVTDGSYLSNVDFFVVRAGTLNITGGEFTSAGDRLIVVNGGKLNITGGTFEDVLNGIIIKGGEVAISGGSFTATNERGQSRLVSIEGNVTVTIAPNGEGGEDPRFHLPTSNSSYAVYVADAGATVAISGGSFGNLSYASSGTFYALYINGASTVNVTGGTFIGSSSGTAIEVAAAGAVFNVSDTAAVYGFKNIIVSNDVTVNISGGSFNPVTDLTTGKIVYIKCRLIEVKNADAEVNISGGTFSDFTHALNITKAATVTITGGTFNPRVLTGDTDVDAFINSTDAATITIGAADGSTGPVVNLGYAEGNKETVKGIYAKLFNITADNARLTVYAGTFNAQYAENTMFAVTSPAALEILGGNFSLSGKGATLISDELLANPNTSLENITVTVCNGAAIPYVDSETNETITLVLVGEIKEFEILSGTHTITGLDDIYSIIAESYKAVTVQERAPSGWISLHLNGDDVNVTLNNVIDNHAGEYFVRVTKGTLTVNGGEFSASAHEKLFDLLGNASVTFNGGSYRASGVYSYILYIADGVNTQNVTMSNADLYVADFGSAPVQVDFTMTDNTITVNGLSEIILTEAREYTISSADDLAALVRDVLIASRFASDKITVEIFTWVPLHLNNPNATLNITGGQYAGSGPFFFRLTAGTLNITGGKFNNAYGDMIQLTGAGTLNINLPNNDRAHGLTSSGSMIYAYGASGATVTIKGGNFVSSLLNTLSNKTDDEKKNILKDEKKAFIFFDGEKGVTENATLTIEGGHFEATRILRLAGAAVEITILDGEFVSDYLVDADLIEARPENAHMFTLGGNGAELVIRGGKFDNKQGNYLFAFNAGDGATLEINGGSFNGAGWFLIKNAATITVNANEDPEKTPVFTDTEIQALDDYFYINATAQITLNAGTYTAGTSEYFIFAVEKGNLTVNNGTYKGSLFFATSDSAIVLNDGTFTASGRNGVLFGLSGTVTAANFTLSKELAFTVEKNAYIFDIDRMGADAVKEVLANANVTVSDYTKAGVSFTDTTAFASEAEVIAFIKTYLPEGKLTFVSDHPVSGLKVHGTSAVLITGGDWTYEGDYLFTVVEGASLNITGGTFTIKNGGLIHITDTAATITFGDQNNAELIPTVTVSNGLKGMFYAEANGVKLNIYAGVFTANDYLDFQMFHFASNTSEVNIFGGIFTITKGSRLDGGKLQSDSAIFYMDGNYVDGVRNSRAVTNITIYGGSFNATRIVYYYYAGGKLNIHGGTFTSNAYAYDSSFMFCIRHKNNQIYIDGGTFTGNKYTYAILYAASNSGGGDRLMAITIVGGTFSKGLYWIYVGHQCTVTIDKTETTSPVFYQLSSGAGSNYGSNVTPRGIYSTGNAQGSTIDIKAGSFRLLSDQPYSVIRPTGGNYTIYPGASFDCYSSIFEITGTLKMNLTIKGGTFTTGGAALMFDFSAAKVADRTAVVESKIVIEGGTFQAKESATVFDVSSPEPMYSLTVKGGTFSSVDARLAFISGAAEASFVIEGGIFTSSAVRMLHVDSNVTPFVIKGGTFTLAERDGDNKADNALLYVVGKNIASAVVEGGTFIDNRTGNNQTFIKMNPRATVKFAGDFKLYVGEQKKNFYYDSDDNANSVPFMDWTESYNGQQYYVCFGYHNSYAPVIESAPSIRPVLGAEGLTFTASVSAEAMEVLASLGTSVSYGTLIFPTKYFANGWENGTDFLASLKAYAAENGKSESEVYLMVPAVKGLVTEADGSLTIRASLINIKEKNYTLDIAGIAYAKVTAADGTETYYYASHVSAGVATNMRAAARVALEDVNTKAIVEGGRSYCYASIMKENRFSRYSAPLQYSLRKYLPVNERNPKW